MINITISLKKIFDLVYEFQEKKYYRQDVVRIIALILLKNYIFLQIAHSKSSQVFQNNQFFFRYNTDFKTRISSIM